MLCTAPGVYRNFRARCAHNAATRDAGLPTLLRIAPRHYFVYNIPRRPDYPAHCITPLCCPQRRAVVGDNSTPSYDDLGKRLFYHNRRPDDGSHLYDAEAVVKRKHETEDWEPV